MNNLFSHEFNTSPIVCSLSPFLLEMALGHRGLPGPHAAPPVGSASRSGSAPAAIPLHGTGAGSALDRAGRKGKGCPWWCVFIPVAVVVLGRQIEAVGLNVQSGSSPGAQEGCGCGRAWTPSFSEPVNIRHFRAALTPKQDPSDLCKYSCPAQRADLLPKGRSCACCWHCRVYGHSYSVLVHSWSGSWGCAAHCQLHHFQVSITCADTLKTVQGKIQLNSQIQAWVFAGSGIRKTSFSPSKLWKFHTKLLKT